MFEAPNLMTKAGMRTLFIAGGLVGLPLAVGAEMIFYAAFFLCIVSLCQLHRHAFSFHSFDGPVFDALVNPHKTYGPNPQEVMQ